MIFVTAGTDKGFGFERLIRACDEIAPLLPEPMLMQIAYTKYEPKNAEFFRYTPLKEYWAHFQKAKLVIAHCSSGPILNALHYRKPLIVVPRRFIYREHADEHQFDFARTIEEKNIPSVKVVYETPDLPKAIDRMLPLNVLESYQPQGLNAIIGALKDFVAQTEKS